MLRSWELVAYWLYCIVRCGADGGGGGGYQNQIASAAPLLTCSFVLPRSHLSSLFFCASSDDDSFSRLQRLEVFESCFFFLVLTPPIIDFFFRRSNYYRSVPRDLNAWFYVCVPLFDISGFFFFIYKSLICWGVSSFIMFILFLNIFYILYGL